MLPLYTRWLTTEQFGSADLISTYASILVSVFSCCVADAVFIFPKNEDNLSKMKYYSSGFLFVGIVALVVALFNFLLQLIFQDSIFGSEWSWLTIGMTFSLFVQNYTQQFTRSLEKMWVFSVTGIVHTLCVALFAFLFIPIWGLNGYILSMIVSNIVAAFFSFFASRSFDFLSIREFSGSHLSTMLKYGVPLIPNSIMWWLVNGFNRPIIENYLGLSALGLYAVANKFPSVVSMVTNVFTNAWGISMLDEFGKPGFNVFFNKVFKLVFFVATVVAFFAIVFSKFIISIFAAEEYIEAWTVLPPLLIGAVLNAASALIGGVFMALKNSKYFFYTSAMASVTSIIATMLFVRFWGLVGCAVAVVLSFGVSVVSRLYFARKSISGFEIWHYFVLVIALALTVVVAECWEWSAWAICSYIILLLTILYLNRDLFIDLKSLIIRK